MKRLSFLFFILMFPLGIALSQYKVMVSRDYPPYNYYNSKQQLVGFNIDIINAINSLYNNQLEIVSGDWKDMNSALDNGEVHAIAGELFFNNGDNDYEFSRSLISTNHSFFYNRQLSPHFSVEALRTAPKPVVAIWQNDVLIHYMKSLNPNAQFVFVRNYSELLEALQQEEVFCAIAHKIICQYHIDNLGKKHIKAGREVFLERNMGFKISKHHPEVATMLNNGLEVLMANGTYQQIYDKWIKQYNRQEFNWRDFYQVLIWSGFSLLLIFSSLLIFNRVLHEKVKIKTRHLEDQLKENTLIRHELEQAKIKAEESNHLKSAFLANMSHEIRTPMNGILGFSELLKTADYGSEEQVYFIDLIQKSGARMLETINNIIDISKIQSGAETLYLKEINLAKMVQEMYNFFSVEAGKKGITLNLDPTKCSDSCTIYTDEYKLHSILTNLIKNAIKFTTKGSVTIGYTKNSEFAHFYVRDTGIGIKQENIDAIFNQFIRADLSYSTEFEGSGLGLSITREYVLMLGGKIWVESEFNVGSTFFVDIPVKFQKQ